MEKKKSTKNNHPKIRPRANKILVKIDDSKVTQSENGVNLPENTEEEKKNTGEVIRVGANVKDIEEGDRVVFGAFAGDPIQADKFGKVEYVLLHAVDTELKEDEVLAFLED